MMPPISDEEWQKGLAEIQKRDEEAARNAPRCFCGDRCDPPYGDGEKCTVCRVRPTGADMQIIVR